MEPCLLWHRCTNVHVWADLVWDLSGVHKAHFFAVFRYKAALSDQCWRGAYGKGVRRAYHGTSSGWLPRWLQQGGPELRIGATWGSAGGFGRRPQKEERWGQPSLRLHCWSTCYRKKDWTGGSQSTIIEYCNQVFRIYEWLLRAAL